MKHLTHALTISLAIALSAVGLKASAADEAPAPSAAEVSYEKVAPYVPRFGRARPLIAVIGENTGTVASDFIIPYGVLAGSGLADVVSVATKPGLLQLESLKIKPDYTTAAFDAAFPQGADYVFVPAVSDRKNADLSAWVSDQAAKGATMVSICNGSMVLANAGVTRGHVATGHWSTHDARVKAYPDTRWVKNVRYVADGKVVSSAGITAAMPTSIAVVEAIGGTRRAEEMARKLGISYWGTKHNSDAFSITTLDYLVGAKNSYLASKEVVGIPISDGVDEIAVALTMEAYENTLRNDVRVVSQGGEKAVRTRGGLTIVADAVEGDGTKIDIKLPAFDGTPSGQMPDKLLDDISRRYGARTARFVILDWEYPVLPK